MEVMNQSGIWPTGHRVLVKPDPIEETTAGGIYIPEADRQQHSQAQHSGVIVAVGKDAWFDYASDWAKAGDRILFPRYQGEVLVGMDDETYRLINDEMVSAILDKDVDLTDFKRRKGYDT